MIALNQPGKLVDRSLSTTVPMSCKFPDDRKVEALAGENGVWAQQ